MSAIKVKELNKYIKKYIAMDYLLSDLEVEGEISNFKLHSNGNIYFTLKDDSAKINSIMYSNDSLNLSFTPQDGDKVIVKGSISTYEREGTINLYARQISLKGIGNLHEEFLILKDKLYKEGLFDEEHKLKVPYFPRKVGVITSPTGAAIRDIINVLRRRNSSVDIVLYPSNVQGNLAVSQLIAALNYFEKHPVDVIILGRGGGSLEELFEFNSEELARRIYKMNIPIISAVGHEVDYVITDFVSDLRAPTPSAAAELVSMSREDLNNSLNLIMNRIRRKIEHDLDDSTLNLVNSFKSMNKSISQNIDVAKIKLNSNKDKLILKSPANILYFNRLRLDDNKKLLKKYNIEKKIIESFKKLDDLKLALDLAVESTIKSKRYNLLLQETKLKNPSFSNCIFLKNEKNKYVLSIGDIKVNENIEINFIDGKATAKINEISVWGDKNE
ncbi:Exodeoxyribonuclease VII large subunit [Anaerosphaera aminiphila DSM 21120]|uniref:Exodeoxyribonuclease 7 large subunit n=1 Tax=Anaerosphaera aminiphila DSM 21120 TaxID=1120995 RepID=A0A1M5P986_9FIRM|nr:exodeoxyribonuclease VII large subunit [Anaerosphaera aminiphila]SHG98336.1 Exodeoxyribonuclease VII large subunit [Anaerosphaera aminiphila DSM 21120]